MCEFENKISTKKCLLLGYKFPLKIMTYKIKFPFIFSELNSFNFFFLDTKGYKTFKISKVQKQIDRNCDIINTRWNKYWIAYTTQFLFNSQVFVKLRGQSYPNELLTEILSCFFLCFLLCLVLINIIIIFLILICFP